MGMLSIGTACHASEPPADVMVERTGYSIAYRAADSTPEGLYRLLEMVCEEQAQSGDIVTFRGEAQGGPLDQLDLSRIAELRGCGPNKSRIVMTSQYDAVRDIDGNVSKAAGPSILLPDHGDIRVTAIALECVPANVNEDGALAGWSGGMTGKSLVTFVDCDLVGHDWGVIYDWSSGADRTIDFVGCEMRGARMVVALMSGSTRTRYMLRLANCNLSVDGTRSISVGASSHADPATGGVYAPICIRSGECVATDCTFSCQGWPADKPYPWAKHGPVRMATIATDHYFSDSSKTTRFRGTNCRVMRCEPGIATIVHDLDFRFGKAEIDNTHLLEAAGHAVHQARGGTGKAGEIRQWSETPVAATPAADQPAK